MGLHVSLLNSGSQGYFLYLVPQEKSSGRTAHYKLTSTVMLWLQTNKSGSGTMNLGGSLTRQVELSLQPLASVHWYQKQMSTLPRLERACVASCQSTCLGVLPVHTSLQLSCLTGSCPL